MKSVALFCAASENIEPLYFEAANEDQYVYFLCANANNDLQNKQKVNFLHL